MNRKTMFWGTNSPAVAKGPVQKIFKKKKSKIQPGWFCWELSGDSKSVSGLSVRLLLSSQWFFKVDGAPL